MSNDFYNSGYNMGYNQQPQTGYPQQDYSPHHQQQHQPQYGYGAQTPQQQLYSSPASTGYDPYSSPGQHHQQQQQPYMSPNQGQNTSQNSDFFNSSGYYNPNNNMGSMGTMGSSSASYTGASSGFEDEPPLMEELGIDLPQIYQTTMTVLNPSKTAATTLMDDPDLAGPLIFCLGFGSLLLLSGKIHFGYIYGVGLIGTAAMYTLLNLMSVNGVSASVTVSVLGYCMLPMCFLASCSALLSLKGSVGIILSGVTVFWAAFSSSKLFVSVLAMYDQQPLVAYPCAILYGIFAVLTVF